ncbi:LysR family transcriptional regulator [Zavarzinia sp. CC-PAN008]|uniref:LysR family transcriptional regulator n=1 Tax=Zavarzinia sp. CC-PAN008 TaxID=3243332 RepID=UPI003F749AE1
MVDWDDLKIALAISRAGSLTAAGHALGVNQSTISRRLAALEDRLGSAVFERTAEGPQATALGRRLVLAAERMEGEMADLARALDRDAGGLAGPVRLHAPQILASNWLAPSLAGLIGQHPGLTLELIADDRPAVLARRDADVALSYGLPEEPDLIVRKLGVVSYGIYAASTYLARAGVPPEGAAWTGHATLGLVEELSTGVEVEYFARLARGSRPVLRANGVEPQLEAARAGLGVALLPCFVADAVPGLVRLGEPAQAPGRELWAAIHRDRRQVPRVRAAIDFMADLAKRWRGRFAGRGAP